MEIGLIKITNGGLSKLSRLLLLLIGLFLLFNGIFYNWMLLFFTIPLFLAITYQTGVEIDTEAKQLRDISGILGSSKGDWQDISEAEYLAIVGTSQSRSFSGFRPSAGVSFSKSEINLFFEDYHTHVFSGNSEKADVYAQKLSIALGLEITDRRKEDEDRVDDPLG